jgi:spermidine synthase
VSLLRKFDPRNLELILSSLNLGFISLSLQVIYARLAVSFAGGNEIYLSIFFFFWLLFTGAGAFLIKKTSPRNLFIILCVFIPVTATMLYLSPLAFGLISQQLISPYFYLLTIMAVAFPICFINGALFSSVAFHGSGEALSSRTYWGEALGALGGGAITTLYYVAGGRDFTLLLFVITVCISVVIKPRVIKYGIMLLGIAGLFFKAGDGVEDALLKIHYQPYKYIGSVSGRLIRYDAVQTGDVTSLYSSGVKLADFPDDITGQEVFYWLYLAKPGMENVAFVGAEYHMVDHFVPNSIKRVYIYPENKWRGLLSSSYLPPEDNAWIDDPIAFFKKNPLKYDAISVNLGSLLSFYDYRFETKRFFALCYSNLAAGGVLSVSVPAYDGMWRQDLRTRINIIYKNLKANFTDVHFVPGSTITFLCADSLGVEFTSEGFQRRYEELQLSSPYFNAALIASRLNDVNIQQTKAQLVNPPIKNEPLQIGYGLSYYFSQFGVKYSLRSFVNVYTIVALLLIILTITLFSGNRSNRQFLPLINIFYFGAISFIIEITSLFYIQMLGGYMYVAMGIIIGLFMAGMVFGAFWGTYIKFENRILKVILNSSSIPYFIFTILALLCLFQPIVEWFWLIMVGLAGVAGGLGYTVNARAFDDRPGLPYGIDLGGAMFGTVVAVALLIAALPYSVVFCTLGASGLILFATNWWTRK